MGRAGRGRGEMNARVTRATAALQGWIAQRPGEAVLVAAAAVLAFAVARVTRAFISPRPRPARPILFSWAELSRPGHLPT